MGRILSIDYGKKRTGIAVSDNLQMIANGLTTVSTQELYNYLESYIEKEDIELIIVGYSRQLSGKDSENMKRVIPFVNRLKKVYPKIPIEFYDERFTSVLANKAIRESGINKKTRETNKGLVDKISATILLEDYMNSRHFKERHHNQKTTTL